jgi:hypothetical protein
MLVNDPGLGNGTNTTLSNQFLTPAGSGDNNYGNGAVNFGAAAPNPVQYALPLPCFSQTCVNVTTSVLPSFSTIQPICYGATAPTLPAASIEGVGGTWSILPVSNTTSGTYTFTPNAACSSPVQVDVVVYPPVIMDGIYHD